MEIINIILLKEKSDYTTPEPDEADDYETDQYDGQYSNQYSLHNELSPENPTSSNLVTTIILAIIAFMALCATIAFGVIMKNKENKRKIMIGLIISCVVLIGAGSGAVYSGIQLKDSDDE